MRNDAFRRVVRSVGCLALVAMPCWAPSAGAEAQTLKIDPQHTSVSFRIRHLFTKVSGRFRQFEGTIRLDEKSLAASGVEVTIQAASIDTNVEARDNDLRGPKFFDVAIYPTLTFRSAAVLEASGSGGKIKGVLTMHGVSRDVVLNAEFLGKVKDPWGNLKYGFHAETTVDRKDYGLTWNQALETGGFLVGDEVEISLDVEAAPAKP